MVNTILIFWLIVVILLPFIFVLLIFWIPNKIKQKLYLLFLSVYAVALLPLVHHIHAYDVGLRWELVPITLAMLGLSGPDANGIAMIMVYLVVFCFIFYIFFAKVLRKNITSKLFILASLLIIVVSIISYLILSIYSENARANEAVRRCAEPLGPGSTYLWKEHCIFSVAGRYGEKYCNKIEHPLWRKECFDAVNGKKKSYTEYKSWNTFTDPALCKTIENDEIILPNPSIKQDAIRRCYEIVEANRKIQT